jgi:hypothetical protein
MMMSKLKYKKKKNQKVFHKNKQNGFSKIIQRKLKYPKGIYGLSIKRKSSFILNSKKKSKTKNL